VFESSPPPVAQQPLVDQGPLIIEASRSHRHTHRTRQDPSERVISRRRELYLTVHSTRNRQTSMHPAGFEPTVLASKRPQTHDLDLVIVPSCTHQMVIRSSVWHDGGTSFYILSCFCLGRWIKLTSLQLKKILITLTFATDILTELKKDPHRSGSLTL